MRNSRWTSIARPIALPILAAVALGGWPSAPLRAQIPDRFTNLQVLPKETPRSELIATMRELAGELGVRCAHCHVGPDDLAGMDFASDEKPQKRAARDMLRMVLKINSETLPALPARDEPRATVTCYTCHRGAERPPLRLDAEIAAVAISKGAAAAIEHFEQLRRDHSADGRYDLRPHALGVAVQRLFENGKPELARAIAAYNAEAHPAEPMAHSVLAEVLLRLGENDAAAASLRRVLELDPDDAHAKRRLEQLEKPTP